MKSKKYIIGLIGFIILAIAVVFALKKDKILKSQENVALNLPTEVKETDKNATKSNVSLSEPQDQLAETKAEIKNFVVKLKKEYTGLNFNKDFKEIFFKMYEKDPKVLEVFQNILIDKEYAKNLLGDDQAYARVFAVKALSEVASKGNADPLINTTKSLTNNFEKKGDIDKGEAADLHDLVTSYVAMQQPKALEKDFGEYLSKLGYSKELKNKKIIGVYDEAVYFPLKSKFGKDKALRIMKTYFPNHN